MNIITKANLVVKAWLHSLCEAIHETRRGAHWHYHTEDEVDMLINSQSAPTEFLYPPNITSYATLLIAISFHGDQSSF